MRITVLGDDVAGLISDVRSREAKSLNQVVNEGRSAAWTKALRAQRHTGSDLTTRLCALAST